MASLASPLPSPCDLPSTPPKSKSKSKSKSKPSDPAAASPGERVLNFVIRAIVLATAIPLFLLFAGVAAVLLLHLWLAGAALRRHRNPNYNNNNYSNSVVMRPDPAPRLSQAQLKRMPCCMWRWPWPKEQCCAVCLEKVQRGEVYRSLPACAHVFHKTCVDKWLLRCPKCPLCRELVRPV